MENESTAQQKYKKRNLLRKAWFQKTLILSSFVLVDYIITLMFITHPNEEANVFARSFMDAFGVASGLTIFSLLANLPIFILLGLLTFYPGHLSLATSPFAKLGLDIPLAWFVAGTHFYGAMSWVVNGPGLLYQLTGATLYLDLIFILGLRHRQYVTALKGQGVRLVNARDVASAGSI
jgi:hypothetical protein